MVSRLPDRRDVDEMRASVEAMPAGPDRDMMEERLAGLNELVTGFENRPPPPQVSEEYTAPAD